MTWNYKYQGHDLSTLRNPSRYLTSKFCRQPIDLAMEPRSLPVLERTNLNVIAETTLLKADVFKVIFHFYSALLVVLQLLWCEFAFFVSVEYRWMAFRFLSNEWRSL